MQFCPQCRKPLEIFPLGGRDRLACPDYKCGFVYWNNPIPVVAAIVEHEDHIVLVRNVGWPKTWYGLVTGFLEAGEMPEDGVLREVEEEIGLKATMQSYLGMYEFYRANQLLIHYHVTVESKDVTIQKNEIADYKWVHIEKVQPWTAGTGRALRDWLASRGIERDLVEFEQANTESES
ncbi:MAG: NUDIX domain-containing protein [Pseudomonadota bacterium]